MRNVLLLLIVSAVVLTNCSTDSGTADNDTLVAFADSLFQRDVDSGYIAGASVLVFQNGQRLIDQSYGYASLELSVPMPEEGVFEIGSVTKQFTAAAILRLVEEGKLSLEDDFTNYLDFDTGGRTITVGQLLNHTSGIPGYTEIPAFWELSLHRYQRDSLVRFVEEYDFLFEPGEAMIYNNSGYYFLGLIIEEVTDTSYADFLAASFFEPLGMEHTGYCSNTEVLSNKVYGYNYSPEGLQQKPYLDHTWPYAAGSLCSTAEDLLTWLRALHGGEVLTDVSYQQMISPETLNDGLPIRYAMGLINYDHYGHQYIGHGGGIHGFLSETRYFPEEDLYVICLLNTAGPKGPSYFADQLTWRILNKQGPAGQPLDRDATAFAGTYSGPVRGRMLSVDVTMVDEQMVFSYENQSDTLSTYLGDRTWADGNDRLIFKDDELRIDQLTGYYRLKKE